MGKGVFCRALCGRGVIVLVFATACAVVFGGSPAFAKNRGPKLVMLTRNAHVDGVVNWAGSDAIVFRSGQNRIVRATPSSGAQTDLWHSDNGVAMWRRATSPDGLHVLVQPFDEKSFQSLSVYRHPSTTLLTSPTPHVYVSDQLWRPDSVRFAFVNDFFDAAVTTMDATGGTQATVLAGDTTRTRRIVSYGNDGTLIVLDLPRTGSDGTLLSIIEGGGTTQLATHVDAAGTSPDGSTVAYFTHDGALHAVASTGGSPIDLGVTGVNAVNVGSFAFSPDMTRLVAGAIDADSNWVAFIVHLDGSGAIATLPDVIEFDWAPDGSRLAANRGRGSTVSLVTFAPDGSAMQTIASQLCSAPAFSPDGRRLACVVQGKDSNDLAMVTFAPPTASIKVTPAQGPPGTTVKINGSGLTGTSAVQFSGVDAASFTVDSPTQVTAVVPNGARSESITVVTPGGTVSTRQPFSVTTLVDLGECVDGDPVYIAAGLKPILTATWHMANQSYLRSFTSAAKTSIYVNDVKGKAPRWDKTGVSDGAGGWLSVWSYDPGTVIDWPGQYLFAEFHVIASTTFSNGFDTFTKGQELFPNTPGCTIWAN